MKLKPVILFLGLMLYQGAAAQWVVSDPGNLAQGIVNASKNIVHTSKTATNMAANFQETVKIYEQTKAYYDALRKVKNLVKGARKVQQTILMVGDINDCYVSNFRLMLSDSNFSEHELAAIDKGYAILLQQAADTVGDLKMIINENGLSIDDKGRIDIIDRCYDQVAEYRGLVRYYTNKNIGVSYLRAKKRNDQDRVLALYGNPSDRYW